MEYFIDTVIKKSTVLSGEATHFALINGRIIRYYISIDKKGITRKFNKVKLSNNISPYSKKLELLMKLLVVTPYKVLQMAHLGFFAKLELDKTVQAVIDELQGTVFKKSVVAWNVIIGNNVDKQKIVLQCFPIDGKQPGVFVKIGGLNSATEMEKEISYLETPIKSNLFSNPKLILRRKMIDGCSYNIQVTEEFKGGKVEPKLTEEIYALFKEIAQSHGIKNLGDIPMAFSHGDFAPWNMKVCAGCYIIFDWEYCGYRFYGYDLIHFLYQIEVLLCRKDSERAIKKAISVAKSYDKIIRQIDSDLLSTMYFDGIIKDFGHK